MSDSTRPPSRGRRQLLKGAIGLAAIAEVELARGAEQSPEALEASRATPEIGDRFMYFGGERDGEIVRAEHIPMGGQPVMTFPKDLATGVVRDGSRLNRVALIRVATDKFSEKMRAAGVDGLVAFSAICTHGGCLVSMWREEDQALFCPCHYSRYDPWNEGAVLGGPAPRGLAYIPIKVENGEVVVAGDFHGRVGNRKS